MRRTSVAAAVAAIAFAVPAGVAEGHPADWMYSPGAIAPQIGGRLAGGAGMFMQRQEALYDRSKTLRWVIGEAGLRWQVGPPDVMVAQLDRVAVLAGEPHLDVRVLPFSRTAAVWHDHGFTILAERADGQPDLVHLELLTALANVTEPQEVMVYRRAYERLAELAVGGRRAVALVRKVKAELA